MQRENAYDGHYFRLLQDLWEAVWKGSSNKFIQTVSRCHYFWGTFVSAKSSLEKLRSKTKWNNFFMVYDGLYNQVVRFETLLSAWIPQCTMLGVRTFIVGPKYALLKFEENAGHITIFLPKMITLLNRIKEETKFHVAFSHQLKMLLEKRNIFPTDIAQMGKEPPSYADCNPQPLHEVFLEQKVNGKETVGTQKMNHIKDSNYSPAKRKERSSNRDSRRRVDRDRYRDGYRPERREKSYRRYTTSRSPLPAPAAPLLYQRKDLIEENQTRYANIFDSIYY